MEMDEITMTKRIIIFASLNQIAKQTMFNYRNLQEQMAHGEWKAKRE